MKSVDHNSFDAALTDLANNGNQLHLLSAAPAAYGDIAGHSLGFVALTLGAGNGAYSLQNGAVSGRRLSLAQQTVPGTAIGTANHAVIVDTVNSKIKAVTTAPNYTMAVGTNQTVPAYDIWEIEDPT